MKRRRWCRRLVSVLDQHAAIMIARIFPANLQFCIAPRRFWARREFRELRDSVLELSGRFRRLSGLFIWGVDALNTLN